MKIKYYLYALLSCVLYTSCEKDSSLDPRPSIVSGVFVRLDIKDKFLNIDKPNDFSFGGLITTPSNNVVNYELFVRRTSSFLVTPSGFVKMPITINSFPYVLKITPQDLATALKVNITDFGNLDRFDFLGFAFDANGNKYDYNNLSAVVKTIPASKQAFKFMTLIYNNSDFVSQSTVINYEKFDNYVQ